MRAVRCVSPHGGAHNGLMMNDDPAPPGFRGALKLEPNEGGWVYNAVLGHVPVGAEVDAPEAPDFICDGFHFVDVATGQGDVCDMPGDGCWCGQHRSYDETLAKADDPPPSPVPGANLSDLLGNGAK